MDGAKSLQQRANRVQALARVSGNPQIRKAAARLQSRADKLRKIDKALLRALRATDEPQSFGALCAQLEVPPGSNIRRPYQARLVALCAAKRVTRTERAPVMYRAVVAQT